MTDNTEFDIPFNAGKTLPLFDQIMDGRMAAIGEPRMTPAKATIDQPITAGKGQPFARALDIIQLNTTSPGVFFGPVIALDNFFKHLWIIALRKFVKP